MQGASEDFEIGSDNDGAHETFDRMPELQEKKSRETVLEESYRNSENDEESDTEKQPSASRRKRVRFTNESEGSIDIDTTNKERQMKAF